MMTFTDIPFHIDNSVFYGIMPVPVHESFDGKDEIVNFIHMMNEFMSE